MDLLTLVVFFPVVGALAILFVREEQKNAIRWLAMVSSLVTLGLAVLVLFRFDASNPDLQMVVRVPWIEVGGFRISYQLGVDGLSILLLLLTALLTPISILSTWSAVEEGVKNFMIFFLLLETGMLGVFLSLDLFLFYIFWEFSLVPMYFLIGLYGGPRRIYAAIKFFLYTMAGSILMLLAILWLGTTGHTFSLPDLIANTDIPLNIQLWLFLAFAAAFAIKVPMWPLHSWLPDAHVEAPTAGSVILAGVLLKMGSFGFLRFNLSLFPEAARYFVPLMVILGIVAIIYGALVCLAQGDMKRLIAFSSVSHMGFVVLGMFVLNEQGLLGSLLYMINHGLSTGALFLIVGILYERRHTRLIADFGGLSKQLPIFAVFFAIAMFSSIGLPGLNGFIAEFLVVVG